MLQDTFAQAAAAAGMTYAEYAQHRYKLARERCGFGKPQPLLQQSRDTQSNELNSQSFPDVQKLNPSSRIPAAVLRCHPAVLNPALVTVEAELLHSLTNEVRRLQDKIDEIRRWNSRSPMEASGIPSPKTLRQVADEVCARYGIKLEQLRGTNRCKRISTARMEYCWRCRHELGRSWGDMGRFLNKDHTSCLYGCRRYEEVMQLKAEGHRPAQGMARFWHLIGVEATNGQDQ